MRQAFGPVACPCPLESNVAVDDEVPDAFARVAATRPTAPWQALHALGGHAISLQNSATDPSVILQQGEVQQRPQSEQALHTPPGSCSDPESRHRPQLADHPRATAKHEEDTRPADPDARAVRTEADRVTAKFVSTDASNEVVLRFDFMTSRDTRVGWQQSIATIKPADSEHYVGAT